MPCGTVTRLQDGSSRLAHQVSSRSLDLHVLQESIHAHAPRSCGRIRLATSHIW